MTILSGVVLMVAIGTVVQNSEQLGAFFAGKSRTLVLRPDEVSVTAGDLARIDVLDNDRAITRAIAERLALEDLPGCGRIFVQSGAVQYLAEASCAGTQRFTYRIDGDDTAPAEVFVNVMPKGGKTRLTGPEPAHPAAPDAPDGSSADAPALVSAPDAPRASEAAAAPSALAGGTDTNPAPAAAPPALAVAPGSAPAAPREPGAGPAAPTAPRAEGFAPMLAAAAPGAPAQAADPAVQPQALARPAVAARPPMPQPGAAGAGADEGPLARGDAPGIPQRSGAPGAPAGGDGLPEPRMAQRPAAPAPAAAPSQPSEPAGGAEETALAAAGTAPRQAARPAPGAWSRPAAPAAVGEATRPLIVAPVAPRTDLAALDALHAPEVPAADDDRVLARAPVPAARPDAAPVYTPEELAVADMEAARPEVPEVPGVFRPATAAAPAAPGAIEPVDGDLVLAAAPAAPAVARAGEGPAAPEAPEDGAAAAAPERTDSDPLVDAEPVTGFNLLDLSDVALLADDGTAVSDHSALSSAGERANPPALSGSMTPTVALARIEVPVVAAAPGRAPEIGAALPGAGALLERPEAPSVASETGSEIALVQPSAGLGPVRDLGAALSLAPVDTSEPPPLAEPETPEGAEIETAALGDARAPVPQENPTEPPAAAERLAALPRAEEACAAEPALTLEVGAAAITAVQLASPCHAGTAAELRYGDLNLGIAIGGNGQGRIEVPGFESSMPAKVLFADGTTLDFTLPFDGTDRIERVGLFWDQPVELDLHALEFDATPDSENHVRPDHPRSYDEVRRTGGGFLSAYEPVDGVGQRAQVYTYLLRRGGETGIVKMMIDFTSRREAAPGTCGDGELAKPGFTVVSTSRGLAERPLRRRLAALDCGAAETEAGGMITNALRNMVITYK